MVKRKVVQNHETKTSHSPDNNIHYVHSESSPMIVKSDVLPNKVSCMSTSNVTSLPQPVSTISEGSSVAEQVNYQTMDYASSPVVSIHDDHQPKFSGMLSDNNVNFVEIDEQQLKCGDSLDVYFDMIPPNNVNLPTTSTSSFLTRHEHQTPKAQLLFRAYSDTLHSQTQEQTIGSQISIETQDEPQVADHTEYITEILHANLENLGDAILPHTFIKGGKLESQKRSLQVQQAPKCSNFWSNEEHYENKEWVNGNTTNSNFQPQYIVTTNNHTDSRLHQTFTTQTQPMEHYEVLQKVVPQPGKGQNIEYMLQKVNAPHSVSFENESIKMEENFTLVPSDNNATVTSLSRQNDSYTMNGGPLVSRSGRTIRRRPEYVEFVNNTNIEEIPLVEECESLKVRASGSGNFHILDQKTSQFKTTDHNIENNSSIDEDSNGTNDGKKSLPHKKRIPKNFKKTKKVNKTFNCDSCDSLFTSVGDLLSHKSNQCPVVTKSFVCELCKKSLDSQLKFFEHLKSHYEPNQKHKCDFCEEVFESEKLVLEHSVCHTREHFNCELCHKTFRKQTLLDSHIATSHSNEQGDRIYTCSVCSETFQNQFLLDNHNQMRHVDDNEIICEHCYITFDSKDKLETHRKSKHKEEAKPRGAPKKRSKVPKEGYECLICTRSFSNKNSFKYHQRGHTGERPHQCAQCGKGFFASGALKVHMRLHSGEKPYKCNDCGKFFRQYGDLHYHQSSVHSDKRLFQCEFCGKSFKRKYCLVVHRRIHTGDRKYKCAVCAKGFRAASYLQDHARIHTGERPHHCPDCGKSFRVRSDMKRHQQTHKRDTDSKHNLPPKETTNATEKSNQPVTPTQQIVKNNNQIQILQGTLGQGQLIITDNLQNVLGGDSVRIVVSGISTPLSQPPPAHKHSQSVSVAQNETTVSPSSPDHSSVSPHAGVILMDSSQQRLNLNVVPRIMTSQEDGEVMQVNRNMVRPDSNICVWPTIFNDQNQ